MGAIVGSVVSVAVVTDVGVTEGEGTRSLVVVGEREDPKQGCVSLLMGVGSVTSCESESHK